MASARRAGAIFIPEHVGTALAACLTDELRLNIQEPHVIRSAIG